MPIAVDIDIDIDIDVMLARRKMSVGELAGRVGITPANLTAVGTGVHIVELLPHVRRG